METNAAVRFAVEVRFVTLADQRVGLLLFLPLALDELQHVRVPDLQRLHFRGAPRLAARFHDAGDRIVDPHERQWPRRRAAAGQLFSLRTDRRQVGAGARSELEQHRLAGRQTHDVLHVVIHALDETRRTLRILVRVLRLDDGLRVVIPAPVARIADDAVLVVQPDVEPHRAVERPVLV